MRGFGRRVGGGRRSAMRSSLLLPGMVLGVASSKSAVVVDVSRTGARLRVSDLPPDGKDLILRMGKVERLAQVKWKRGDICGVEFDEPLTSLEFFKLEQLNNVPAPSNLDASERLAFAEWQIGLMR